jgi:UV DNA damage repair endonuclease
LEKTTTLIKKYDKLLSQHPGKWVAIADDKVIATAESIEDLTRKIKKLNDVLVAYSPTPSEKKVGYLL